MTNRLISIFKGDRVLWVILILLSLSSLVIVYSATGKLAFREAGGNTYYYLIRQIKFITIGFAIMLLFANILRVSWLFKLAPLGIVLTVIALILAIIQYKYSGGYDKETSRSLTFKMFSFQPAEMAKIALVLFASWMLSRAQNSKEQMKIAFYWVTGVTAAVCFLIFLSNFSTAAMIFLSIMVLMFIARVPILRIAILGLIGLAFGVVLYFSVDLLPDTFGRVHTFKERISDFVSGDKEEAVGTTQADYAKLAIFEGGVIGKGPGNSEVSNYMEAAYNDFIYAIVIEEYGIVGGAILMLLYLILLFRGIAIVRRCERTFPAFMVTGLVLIMIFQAFINMGVSAGAVPVTGQPLPWVSMGGSSMIFTSFSLGIILSVSANNQRSKKAVEQPIADEVVTEDQTM